MSKVWAGEPAAIKGVLGTVLTVLLAWLNGNTSLNDGLLSILTVLVPTLTGLWIRPSVSPVSSSGFVEGS